MANNSNFIQRALGIFNLTQTKGSPGIGVDVGSSSGRIIPDNDLLLKGKKHPHLTLPNYTPLQQIWSWFLQETYDSSESLQNRRNRYIDLDFAVKNNTLIHAAVSLFADEATQCDISGIPIRVKAKKDVQNYITGLLDDWGITQQVVRETIWNKVLFGDSFELNDVHPKEGIVKVTPVTVWDVADRLEFEPSKVIEQMRYYNSLSGASNRMKLDVLMAELRDETESASSFFNRYCFGFELVGGKMTPPWGVTHYRAFSMLREFAPWGRSRFINILPMFRQLMSAEGLMQVARAASFPKDVYSVGTRQGASVTEKWEALEEFQEQLNNAGLTQGSKELPSIGSTILVPKELVDFNTYKSDIDVDAIADVEYLRDNLIMGLMIPKGYLIVDEGGWGTSGQSLLQQFKPFGRLVFSDQSDYMAGLSEKIKIHLEITQKFNGWNTPFELVMDFPVIEEAQDRMQHRAEELTLANNTLDTLKNILGVEKVPPDIIKDAFGMLTSLPQETIDKYVDALIKANPEPEEEPLGGEDFGGFGGGMGRGAGVEGGEDSESELGFGGGTKSKVDPIGDIDKASKAFGEALIREKYNSRSLTRTQCYERARNRWNESSCQDILQEEIIKLKAKSRIYLEGKGQGVHYLNSLKNETSAKKNKKVLESFLEAEAKGEYNLREKLAEARTNKEDWERFDD
jgi:hypothetical protein